MKKSYKYVLVVIAFFIFLVAFLFGYKALNYSQRVDYTELTIAQLREKMENEDSFVLVIGSDDCEECIAYTPVVQAFMHGQDEELFHLNMTAFSDEEVDEIKTEFRFETTPATVFFIGGSRAASLPGRVTYGELETIFGQYRQLVDAAAQAVDPEVNTDDN